MHWATQLLSQCQAQHDAGRLSAANALETTAYTLVLNGRFLRYRDEFEDALAQLCVARGILDELAERAETSRDQALATCFADEVGPEIRYCAHELGHPRAYDVDNIVREQAARHRAQIVEGYDALVQKLRDGAGAGAGAGSKGDERRKLKTLLWEGEVVPVRNPELVDVLIKVQEGEVKLREESTEISEPARTTTGQEKKKRRPAKGGVSKRGVAAYDNVLLALSDAEEVARKLVEAQNVSNKWSHSQPSSTSLTRFLFFTPTPGKRVYFWIICTWRPRHSLCPCLHRLSPSCAAHSTGFASHLRHLGAERSGIPTPHRTQDDVVVDVPEREDG